MGLDHWLAQSSNCFHKFSRTHELLKQDCIEYSGHRAMKTKRSSHAVFSDDIQVKYYTVDAPRLGWCSGKVFSKESLRRHSLKASNKVLKNTTAAVGLLEASCNSAISSIG